MDDFKAKTLKVKQSEVGDLNGVDKSALSGYKAERVIKRIISTDVVYFEDYLLQVFKIPKEIRIKLFEEDDERKKRLKYELPEPYEYFTSSELLMDSVTGMTSRQCLRALQYYGEDNKAALCDYIMKVAPIQIL